MKTIKQFLLSALFLAGTTAATAQITVDGNVFNSGAAVSGETVTLDWQTGNTTVLTDAAGHYNYTFTDSSTQGSLTASIIDCNGYTISETGSWNPGNTIINLNDLAYCSSNTFDVNLSLSFMNGSGSAIAIDISWDGGTTFSNVNTDVNGNYSTTYNTTGPGTFNLVYVDCNGNTISLTENYSYPNNYINISSIDYCPAVAPTCQANYSLAQQVDSTQTNFINVIDIYNSSIGSNLTYTWDFGDNSPTYTGTNFTHTYATSGSYLLCLTVNDGAGCTDTFCDSLIMASNGLLNGKANESFTLVMGNGDNTTETASIENIETTMDINVYPNPAINNVNVAINSTKNQIANVQIIDLSGKTVINNTSTLSSGNNTISFDLSTVNKGIYLVRISTEGNTYNSKLVIK